MHAINLSPVFCCTDNRVLQALTMSLAFIYNYGTMNADKELRVWHLFWWLCIILPNELQKGETKEEASVLTHWNQGPEKSLIPWYYKSWNWCQYPLLHSRGNCVSGSYSTAHFVSLVNTTSIVFPQDSLNLSPSTFTLSSPLLSTKYKQMSCPGIQEEHPQS